MVRHCLDGARLWKRVHSEASVYVGRRGGKGSKSENASILILDFVKWRSRQPRENTVAASSPVRASKILLFEFLFFFFFFLFHVCGHP